MRALVSAIVFVSLLCCAMPARAAGPTDVSAATSGTDDVAAYAQSVRAAARSLEAASRGGARSVPSVHVPPAPLPGPPRYSPSLDDWLQAVLVAARAEKPKNRTRTLRHAAAALRYAIVSAHLPANQP